MKEIENKKNGMDKYQTIINVFSSIIVLLISGAISFILSPYIIKHIGEEANGFVQLANNFTSYASLITIALNSMASRFISICYHNGDKEQANTYYSSVLCGNILIMIILIIASVGIVLNIDNLIQIDSLHIPDVQLLFAFVFVSFFISQIASVINVYLFVTNKVYITNLLTMISTLIRAILLVLLFSIFDINIAYVTLTTAIASLLLLISYSLLKKRILPDLKFNIKLFDWQSVKVLITSGLWNTINQSGNLLLNGMDLLLTNIFINPLQMGVLSVAKIVPTYIIQLAQTVNSNITPSLLIAYTKDTKDRFIKEIESTMKISTVLLVVPIAIFCTFSIEFYSLWVPTMDAVELSILSFLAIFPFIPLAGTQVLYNIFTVTNNLKINSLTYIITGVMNIVIVLFLLKCTDLGIYAIAGTSSVLTIFRNLFVLIPYAATLIDLKWNYFYKDIGKAIVCCGICVIAGLLTKIIFNGTSWMSLILAIGISAVLSVFVSSLVVLNKNERKILFGKLKRR